MGESDAKVEARRELWRRYDAGDLRADELEARLKLLDEAATDDAVRAATTGAVPLRRRLPAKKLVIGTLVVLTLVLGGTAAAVVVGAAGDAGTVSRRPTSGVGVAEPALPPPPPLLPVPEPDIDVGVVPAKCDELLAFEDFRSEFPIDGDAAPTSPLLLSDPPYVPEGYEVDVTEAVEPGTDTDLAMSTAAGDPPPIEILRRDLAGELRVTMRAFLHPSAEEARAAADSSGDPTAALCNFGGDFVETPDRPEIFAVVVADAGIPPSAFAGWRLGERRFSVAVEAASPDREDLDAAVALAVEVAGAELDAARTPPG